MNKLDPEEKELLESIERGEWRSVDNLEEEKKRYREYAKATFKKTNALTFACHKKISRQSKPSPEKKAFLTKPSSRAFYTNTYLGVS